MYRYLVVTAFAVAWIVLAVFNPALLPKAAPETQPAVAETQPRWLDGELQFAGTPYWSGLPMTLALDITEVDPVEHTAAGTVMWTSVNRQGHEPAAQRVEAAVTHIFFGADVAYGDPASAVVVAQVLSAEGATTAQRGDYAYFWLRGGDEQRPAQWGIFPYSVEPRSDFFPYDRSPAKLGYFDVSAMQITDPWAPVAAESGEIVLGAAVE